MQWPGIGLPMEFHVGARHFRIDIVRCDGHRTIQHRFFFRISPEESVANRNLLERVEIAWVKLKRALHITQALFVLASPTHNVPGQFGNPRVIRQCPMRHFEFGESPIIIEIPAIQMFRASNVRFSRFGPQLECRLDRSFSRGQTSGRVVGANQEVELIVGERELALRLKKGWVPRQRLI